MTPIGAPPPPWKPGDPYRWAIVEACPRCGGTAFRISKTEAARRRKVCKTCEHALWREGDGGGKVSVAGLPRP